MIVININAEGTAQVVTPSHIFQGSNQSAVTVLAPVPTTTAMSIAFKLPDGTSTPYYPMTWIQADNGLSQYEFTLNAPLTQKAGHAAIALMALYTDGRQTSQLVDFEIEQSIVPEVPPDIDEGAYEEILKSLQKDRTDITDLQGQMNDIQETAEKAEAAANNAVETANEAKSTADGLADSIAQANTTAENAVNIANGAVATANEAKATADGLADSIAQANTKADTAISTANEADTTAEEAKEIAQEALDQSKVTGTKVNVDGVFQTDLEFSSDPQTQISDLYTRAQELENSKVNKAGDTMTGDLQAPVFIGAFKQADSSKNYVDLVSGDGGLFGVGGIAGNIYRLQQTLRVDASKLEPTSANGWTIGGTEVDLPDDGVYLINVTSATSPAAGDWFSPGICVFNKAEPQLYTLQVVVGYYLVGMVKLGAGITWNAIDIRNGGSFNIARIAYKRIA